MILGAERPARAQSPVPAPLVAYDAPAGCPQADAFYEQVALRTRLWRGAELRVEVAIRVTAEGARGRVSLERAGVQTQREIVGARCEEVTRALALIVAILIDPAADTRPFPVATQPQAPEPALRPVAPARPAERQSFAFAGTELIFQGGFAPGLSPGQRLYGGALRRSPRAALSSLRLSGFRAASGSVAATDGATAAFELWGARLEACSYGVSAGALRLVPCGFGELGALSASGTHPERSRDETVFWAALGPALRGSAAYRNVLFLELEAGAVLPLTSYRFEFSGQDPVHETPGIAAEFSLGLGVRFP